MKIKIKQLNTDIPLPTYQTNGSAGMDICACIDEPITIKPNSIELISTGIAIAVPKGLECQVRSRSGLAAKNSIFVLNSPGTIDSDYRGEIKVILANLGKTDYIINRGDRIAQLIIARYETIEWDIVIELDETNRGEGGFGSTG
jgi:dUTP pyrophosphatase